MATCPNCQRPLPPGASCPKCHVTAVGSARMTMHATGLPGVESACVVTLDLPPDFLARYEMAESLGKGGMGEVFRARDRVRCRAVAIKFCVAYKVPGVRERFEKEADLMRRIQHPNVVGILDSGAVEKMPYLVMPLVNGRTLREKLSLKRAMPLEDVVRYMQQVLSALDAAHNAGVIHRDLKPENILITIDRQAMVLDLGVAKSWADGSALMDTAMITGTPLYMAPEQCRGAPTGLAADLYAAGVILFEMLAGSPPFTASSPTDIMKAHMEAPIPRVSERNHLLDPGWDLFLARALAKSPADRFPDGRSFSAALTKAGQGVFSGALELGQKALAAQTQLSVTAMVKENAVAAAVGILIQGALALNFVMALVNVQLALLPATLLPLSAIFFLEEPGRFAQLQASPFWRNACYGTAFAGIYAILSNFAPQHAELWIYGMLTLAHLAWFGGYHAHNRRQTWFVRLHRRLHPLVLGLTMMLFVFAGESMAAGLAAVAVVISLLGLVRPPAQTRHLSIATATTMILAPGLFETAVAEELKAGEPPKKLPGPAVNATSAALEPRQPPRP